ncbi:Protein translocase subunit SecF [Carbonactinospora thermoautotrophica]|uniref:Protein-export membrane protein SecF n=1 Tax=Carbonactinospora thermoautotrophica TaxID=1469144 RepID=A0A132MS49_9ACTN|nr:protein translocase subunit SecF [Carbonactinospora thermoautotrophica]KWX00661.1 Protein translocase subunit SecF [Carbonactinospora thermoautotrophica]
MSRNGGGFGARLYRGEVSYDFVGRQKTWYLISAVILLVAAAGLAVRGLNLGVEFRGGTLITVKNTTATVEQVREAVKSVEGVGGEPIVQKVGGDSVRIQLGHVGAGAAVTEKIQDMLEQKLGVTERDISIQQIGPSWGGDISRKALLALGVFLLAVIVYLSVMFEWKMAFSAVIALLHDLVITVGVYALTGFEVTPATVIGILTILGYSLYDTVVVFDKVKENTRGLTGGARMTYSQAANLAVNQTLIRSINTSVTALLPVGSILFVGAGLLGAGVLKDIALAIFVGIAAGTYSSIFIATPLLADLKEREPAMKALAKRVQARQQQATAGADGGKPTGAAAPAEEKALAEATLPGSAAPTGARSGQRPQPRRAGTRPSAKHRGKKRR